MTNENEVIEEIEAKLSGWKAGVYDARTLCVANSDEIDFFPSNYGVADILKTLVNDRGMTREDALNYLKNAQFLSATIH